MPEPETCCGFGGTFSQHHGELAGALADAKLGGASSTGAEWLVSGDAACLLHRRAAVAARGSVRARPPGRLLAGGLPGAASPAAP